MDREVGCFVRQSKGHWTIELAKQWAGCIEKRKGKAANL
jgi:hypothetical protein